jgi:DNA-binding CsgD family transcriptional regulator
MKIISILGWFSFSFFYLSALCREDNLDRKVELMEFGIIILWVFMPWGTVFSSHQSGSAPKTELTKKERVLFSLINEQPQGRRIKDIMAKTKGNKNTLRTHLLNMKKKGIIETASGSEKEVWYRVKKP